MEQENQHAHYPNKKT
uniref:Uncharacterized protein n=1 Tax=Rhizophora mucronata TaxID=61149 RepID=A0A2P2P5J5_RHIMU